MSTVRNIAVASTPLTATSAEAVHGCGTGRREEAGRFGRADLVPARDRFLPGHRSQARKVPDVTAQAVDEALQRVADAARSAGVATIVGVERPTAKGRLIQAVVIDADGAIIGEQTKTQIAPRRSETTPQGAVAVYSPLRGSRSGS